MQRLFSLLMAVLMMLSLTACGGNATSSTPASVSGSGSESGEQVSEAAKRLEEQKELNIMFVAGNFAESMQKIYADYEKEYGVKKCYYGHLHGSSHNEAIEGKVNWIEFYLVSSDYLNFNLVKVK